MGGSVASWMGWRLLFDGIMAIDDVMGGWAAFMGGWVASWNVWVNAVVRQHKKVWARGVLGVRVDEVTGG